jgi:hypothetical protein
LIGIVWNCAHDSYPSLYIASDSAHGILYRYCTWRVNDSSRGGTCIRALRLRQRGTSYFPVFRFLRWRAQKTKDIKKKSTALQSAL